MKAVRIDKFGGREVLQTVCIDEPIPNTNEVKIKLYTTGLNPNESYTISGTYGAFVPELPYVPGFDGAGVVEEIGPEVQNIKVGDRVFLSGFKAKRNTGTYAEKVVIDTEHVYHLPDKLSMDEGAGLGIPMFAAYRALFQWANIQLGDYVLIHGASGAVGSLAIQMAKAVGAIVIGTSSTKEGRQQIIKMGADFAFDHLSTDNKYKFLRVTEERGPDVIIEMLANKNLEMDMQIIAVNGCIVIVGSRGSINITPRHLMGNEALVTAVNVGRMTVEDKEEALHGVMSFIENDAIKLLIGKKFTLDKAAKAHKEMMEGSGNGRTVFVMAEE